MVPSERPALAVRLDDVDRAILAILRRDGRAAVSDIARAVGLSPAPVTRRIQRMERAGVIRGYAAAIDERAVGTLEAFTEIRLRAATETTQLSDVLRDVPEVVEFAVIAGDPDVLLRLRVDDGDHLQRVVNGIRRTGKVSSTKTLIVLQSWDRSTAAESAPP